MTVHYKGWRLAAWALAWGLSGAFTLYSQSDDGAIFDTVAGCLLLAMGAFTAYAAIDTRPAISSDASGLTVRTMFARRTDRWSDVLLVAIEHRAVRLWGIIPIGRRKYLSIMLQGGPLGSKRMRLLGSWLSLPPGGLNHLRESILDARTDAGVAPTMVGPGGTPENGGFDPDAVIARYLAAKADAPAPSNSPTAHVTPLSPGSVRPSFGRRGVGTATPVDPLTLAR
ncbi:MAG: hypothetical protein ABIO85_04360 [Sphingomicrobium sp.]